MEIRKHNFEPESVPEKQTGVRPPKQELIDRRKFLKFLGGTLAAVATGYAINEVSKPKKEESIPPMQRSESRPLKTPGQNESDIKLEAIKTPEYDPIKTPGIVAGFQEHNGHWHLTLYDLKKQKTVLYQLDGTLYDQGKRYTVKDIEDSIATAEVGITEDEIGIRLNKLDGSKELRSFLFNREEEFFVKTKSGELATGGSFQGSMHMLEDDHRSLEAELTKRNWRPIYDYPRQEKLLVVDIIGEEKFFRIVEIASFKDTPVGKLKDDSFLEGPTGWGWK